MLENNEIYDWADEKYNRIKSLTGFTQLLATTPIYIKSDIKKELSKRLSLIHQFQDICISIFRDAISNNKKDILYWLLNETPESLGLEYHKKLHDCHFTKPVFIRTDEMILGKIAEIQCPGSLWGELQLLYEFYQKNGFSVSEKSPVKDFSLQLIEYLKEDPKVIEDGEKPCVQYLVDNASAPAGVRYFIQQSEKYIHYWGISPEIHKADDCNFIRTHSFFGLCGENYFKQRLENIKMIGLPDDKIKFKKFKFDYPPYVLFDQKATLALPFWSKTKSLFSDEIRNLFLFTTPLISEMIELEDGEISVYNFCELPRSKRNYYLKYAGSDVSINWGSKTVYRLRNMGSIECLRKLIECIDDSSKGKIWVMQKELSEHNQITYWTRDGFQETDTYNTKYSCFYGPYDLIGIVSSYRKHYKVHGQQDTVIASIMTY